MSSSSPTSSSTSTTMSVNTDEAGPVFMGDHDEAKHPSMITILDGHLFEEPDQVVAHPLPWSRQHTDASMVLQANYFATGELSASKSMVCTQKITHNDWSHQAESTQMAAVWYDNAGNVKPTPEQYYQDDTGAFEVMSTFDSIQWGNQASQRRAHTS